MTEVLTNYDILNTAQIATDTVSVVSPVTEATMDNTSDFTKILDKQIVDTQVKTLGDIKNTLLIDGDMLQKMADFKEILADATSEANVESSLDLTLARDINDIIGQLKGAINEYAEDTTSDEAETDSDSDNIVQDIVENVAPVVFEQVLTFADKLVEQDSTGIGKEILNEVKDFIQTEAEENVLVENNEELALDTDTEQIKPNTESLDSHIDKHLLKELNIESVKAETDSSNSDSMMNRQSPEEYSVKVMLDGNIEKFEMPVTSAQNVQSTAQTNVQDINPSRIIEQITKHLENMHSNSKISIVLNPESLGKVNLQIMNTQEGLSAQFTVSSNEVRDLLMKGLDGLKEVLLSQGVGVDNISVKLNETEKSSYNPDWKDQDGSRGGNKDQGQPSHKEKEKGLFEKTIAKTFKKENGNV